MIGSLSHHKAAANMRQLRPVVDRVLMSEHLNGEGLRHKLLTKKKQKHELRVKKTDNIF